MFQSNELDCIQELFDLLQIKSDLWNFKNNIEGECSSKKSAESKSDSGSEGKDESQSGDKEFLVNLENLMVKKERSSADDDDREEGEIQDADEEECGRLSSRRRSSSNPVNLSLNTKCSDSEASKDNASAEEQEIEVILEYLLFML